MTGLAGGRIGPGATQHCAHGKQETLHDIVDWRPFEYVTYHIRLPFGAVVRQMVELTPLSSGGTHVSMRVALAESDKSLAQVGARLMTGLMAKKLLQQQRVWQAELEKVVAEDVAAGKTEQATAA